GGDAEVAEGKHGGVGRRRIPGGEVDVGGLAGLLERIETLGDEIEDSGVVEVVPEHVIESFRKVGVFGIAGRGLEVGGGQAYALGGESCAAADPVLAHCRGQQNQR